MGILPPVRDSLKYSLLTLLDGDVSGVEDGGEGGLREGVFEGKQLILGHSIGARLENRAGADGR